jgi:DNA-directed RNA polymerase subunit RPC12/RpoP
VLQYPCDQCRRALVARHEFVGDYVVCPHCEHVNQIPEPAPKTLKYALPDPAQVDGLRCPRCGYSLRGLDENLCPECGRRFDAQYLLRTRWGQEVNPLTQFATIVGVVLIIFMMLMCLALVR